MTPTSILFEKRPAGRLLAADPQLELVLEILTLDFGRWTFIILSMPKVKPLKKLITKARDVRAHHRERHQPSGYGFALADRLEYLDKSHWDRVTAHDSLFLSRRYLS